MQQLQELKNQSRAASKRELKEQIEQASQHDSRMRSQQASARDRQAAESEQMVQVYLEQIKLLKQENDELKITIANAPQQVQALVKDEALLTKKAEASTSFTAKLIESKPLGMPKLQTKVETNSSPHRKQKIFEPLRPVDKSFQSMALDNILGMSRAEQSPIQERSRHYIHHNPQDN